MTTSVTRPCFTAQHQTCKTNTKTDFLVWNRSCPKTDGLRPHHWSSHPAMAQSSITGYTQKSFSAAEVKVFIFRCVSHPAAEFQLVLQRSSVPLPSSRLLEFQSRRRRRSTASSWWSAPVSSTRRRLSSSKSSANVSVAISGSVFAESGDVTSRKLCRPARKQSDIITSSNVVLSRRGPSGQPLRSWQKFKEKSCEHQHLNVEESVYLALLYTQLSFNTGSRPIKTTQKIQK